MDSSTGVKQYRVNGLSFAEELRGESLPFGKQILYLGLNGVLRSCNWACTYCLEGSPQDRKEHGKEPVSLDRQLALIDEAQSLGMKSVLITGGEPFAPKRKDETLALVQRGSQRG